MERVSWGSLQAECVVRVHESATRGKKARGIMSCKALLFALLAACAMLLALPLTAYAANDELTSQDLGANLGALDQQEYVVTVDFGSKHAEWAKACFEGQAGFTVNGSEVSSVQQGKTIRQAKAAFRDALYESGLDNWEDSGEWFTGEYGLKTLSEYADEEEFRNEEEEMYETGVPSAGVKLHAFWAQPVDDFEVTVKSLVCGTTVKKEWSGSMYYSDPRIKASVVGNARFDNTYSSNWLDSNSREILEGQVIGGQDYHAHMYLTANFGYFFSGNEKVALTNGELTNYSSDNSDFRYGSVDGNIPAVHDWGEATYTWSSDNKTVTASHTCQNADCSETETETGNVTSKVTKQPTCSAQGQATYTASFKKDGFETQTKTVEIAIDPNAHEWGSPTYAWSADNKTVTAKRTCKHNAAHVQTEKSTVTQEVTKQPTCIAKGQITYTVSFENAAFKTQTKTMALDVDPQKHAWGSPTYTWSKDNSTVVAVRKCANNATHMQVEVASSTSKVTKTATSKAAGTRTYTAKFKASWAKTQKKDVKIAKLPPEPTSVALAKLTAKGKTKLRLSWSKVAGAGRYLAKFAPCNTKGKTCKLKRVKTLGAGTTSLVRSGLKENTLYKAKIVAQAKKGGKWVTISKSELIHAATGNQKGKYTNATALALNTTNMTLKAGKTATLSGLVQKAVEGEGMTAAVHSKLLRFISNNKRIATVNAEGKVTAKGPGTCKIYVQTSNGIWKSCEVTVK